MAVRVLFFGATADIVGVRSRPLDVGANATASQVVDQLASDHPALRRHKLLFSVNQEYVSGDVTLNDGDEIGIFTAVSGG
jgi:molybdopterin converting factor small subunit